MAETWHNIVMRKREQIKSTAPAAWQQLDDDPDDSSDIMFRIEAALSQVERRITAMHGDALLEALRNNRLTTQAVVSAFCHRAYLAHRYVSIVQP